MFITITRPGKESATVEVLKGSSVEAALIKAGFTHDQYSQWSLENEDGDTLTLASILNGSTSIMAGKKVAGAFFLHVSFL